MAKVGPWVIDPRVGASSCTITLETGEKILLSHDEGKSRHGQVTIERLKLFGFSSDRILVCDLESPQGSAVLRFLTRDAATGTREATPLGAFVRYLKTSRSLRELETRCTLLMAIRRV